MSESKTKSKWKILGYERNEHFCLVRSKEAYYFKKFVPTLLCGPRRLFFVQDATSQLFCGE
jgi:hypothetical protein